MVAELIHLAPLPPADEALFQRYIECGASLAALADSLKDRPLPSPAPPSPDSAPPSPTPSTSSLSALYLWSSQPHIAPWLEFHNAQLEAELVRELRGHQRDMIAQLRDLAKSDANPVERRRAAVAILRCSPGGIPHRPARGTRRPTTAGHHSSKPADPAPPLIAPDLDEPFPPSPNLPAPLTSPAPGIADDAIARLVESCINKTREPSSPPSLRAFCTPKTLFRGLRVPTDPLAFRTLAADLLAALQPHSQHPTSCRRLPPEAGESQDLTSRFGIDIPSIASPRQAVLKLRRRSPGAQWLIESVDVRSPNSG